MKCSSNAKVIATAQALSFILARQQLDTSPDLSPFYYQREAFLRDLLEEPQTQIPNLLQDIDYGLNTLKKLAEPLEILQGPIGCDLCKAAVSPLNSLLTNPYVMAIGETLAIDICEKFEIEGGIKSVCQGSVDMMAQDLLPALAGGVISPQRICDETLHLCKSPSIEELNVDNFVQKRLASKPELIKNNTFVDDLYKQIAADSNAREVVRSIQLADLHIDFSYTVGAPTQCSFPICCRDNGQDPHPKVDSPKAQFWGDYNCDLPTHTLKAMFDFIAANQETLKTEFITWTGDNSAHNVWSNTNEEVTRYTQWITDALNESLGAESSIDIFPAMGNHDTWPVNVQDFSAPGLNQPINSLAQSWNSRNWLSAEEAEEFRQYGFYSKPLKHNSKGRVISLNMQACNNMNWWLLEDRQDPGGQIAWLEQ